VILAYRVPSTKSSSVYTSGAFDTISAGQPTITLWNRRNFGLETAGSHERRVCRSGSVEVPKESVSLPPLRSEPTWENDR
jgi:hypothetical protein